VAVIPELSLPTARRDIVVRELVAPSLTRRVSSAMPPPGGYTPPPPAAQRMQVALHEVATELRAESPAT
jgi:hypothetical protein